MANHDTSEPRPRHARGTFMKLTSHTVSCFCGVTQYTTVGGSHPREDDSHDGVET